MSSARGRRSTAGLSAQGSLVLLPRDPSPKGSPLQLQRVLPGWRPAAGEAPGPPHLHPAPVRPLHPVGSLRVLGRSSGGSLPQKSKQLKQEGPQRGGTESSRHQLRQQSTGMAGMESQSRRGAAKQRRLQHPEPPRYLPASSHQIPPVHEPASPGTTTDPIRAPR